MIGLPRKAIVNKDLRARASRENRDEVETRLVYRRSYRPKPLRCVRFGYSGIRFVGKAGPIRIQVSKLTM